MKKSELRTMVRKIVREEVAMAIQEVITELKQPTQSQPTKPIQEKHYSKNKVLNDVLNETANGDWKTLGGGEYTSDRMNELVGGQYADMMEDTSQTNVNLAASMGVNPNTPGMDFLKKDYSSLMKAIDKKKG
jgi:hypothetical protein|tara:strand:+ start:934 stop:1329 length:396 start_codon:yes stop_codon:yes gene_type:complete